MISTYKNPMADYRKNLEVVDHQFHKNLATDVTGMSFDAQRYEDFGYGYGSSRVFGPKTEHESLF